MLGDLSSGDRQKIMTICTIDVHARDVVAKMIQLKVIIDSLIVHMFYTVRQFLNIMVFFFFIEDMGYFQEL